MFRSGDDDISHQNITGPKPDRPVIKQTKSTTTPFSFPTLHNNTMSAELPENRTTRVSLKM